MTGVAAIVFFLQLLPRADGQVFPELERSRRLLHMAKLRQLRVHYTALVQPGEKMKREQTAKKFFGEALI